MTSSQGSISTVLVPAITRKPEVLHAASIERIDEADLLHVRERWSLCMYAAGLAVETLFQAFAYKANIAHDARHDLKLWLDKCPVGFIEVVKTKASNEWSLLNTHWDNDLRYLSEAGLLGRIRRKQLDARIKGDRKSVLRECSRRCLDSARTVHSKGLVKWQ